VEIWAKCVKTYAKSLKIRAKMALDVLLLEKNGAQNQHFLKVIFCSVVFFGQVWENLGKNPSHPQKFACSYTYAYGCLSCFECRNKTLACRISVPIGGSNVVK